ncbi:MAG TPA: toprim domain-containing protein [Archaeoglobus veneficus]|nr:toprim domain-containing protein [Archaeoglobus veneficus]
MTPLEFFELSEIIDDLKAKSEEGAIIIVEGSKDVAALRELGIGGTIVKASSIPTSVIVDKIGARDVIILTDWDRRGELLVRELARKFSSWGITPDVTTRKRIFALVSKEITSVENLSSFYFKVEGEIRRGRL